MRETRQLEFKEQVTNTFLKTVSAFANCDGGEILFGLTDDGEGHGLEDPGRVCLDIENKINDSLDPVPEYTLSINERTSVVTLKVMEGLYKPYFYKSKAYRRNDTATIPVDRLKGMDKEDYLRGGISMLRNRIIGNVFFRLQLIERFGTGVKRIKEEYRDSRVKPSFDMTENTIRITLPVKEAGSNLTEDENRVYRLLKGREVPSSAISEAAGFGKNKTVGILKALVAKG